MSLVNDADVDSDRDGLTNVQEFQFGTIPNDPDSDGEGLTDYDEVITHGTDPIKVDIDKDGMSDVYELSNNFNPLDGGDCPSWVCGGGIKIWMYKAILDKQATGL
tara:strand:- start:290 stop:604 length:315 start_codon:yes stop_codon:yes gene_type:complete